MLDSRRHLNMDDYYESIIKYSYFGYSCYDPFSSRNGARTSKATNLHNLIPDKFISSKDQTNWEDNNDMPSKKPKITKFLHFCDFILDYEKYKPHKEKMNDSGYSPSSSERSTDSFSSSESNSSFNNNESASEDMKNNSDTDTDSDSWNLITCYCMKPFANRPMIECSACRTWLHMSCAIIRSNNIPEHFVCQSCREAKGSRRRSARIRTNDRRFL